MSCITCSRRTPSGQRELLNLLRFLGNTLRIPLICLGTKEAWLAVRSDEQLENRFEPFALPPWRNDGNFGRLLASFEAALPLRRRSGLAASPLKGEIYARSEGVIGEVSTLLETAAIAAISSGQDQITLELLKAMDYRSPTERRRRFEATLE